MKFLLEHYHLCGLQKWFFLCFICASDSLWSFLTSLVVQKLVFYSADYSLNEKHCLSDLLSSHQ